MKTKTPLENISAKELKKIKEYEKNHDDFGNNINFPDKIMGPMTMKGLLGKWAESIIYDIKYCLAKYYLGEDRNIDAGDIDFVKNRFRETSNMMHKLTPVLEDMVNENIYGLEDIMISIYGSMTIRI